MKQEFKIISDFIEKKTRVLDVGCGDGTLMQFLKDPCPGSTSLSEFLITFKSFESVTSILLSNSLPAFLKELVTEATLPE